MKADTAGSLSIAVRQGTWVPKSVPTFVVRVMEGVVQVLAPSSETSDADSANSVTPGE